MRVLEGILSKRRAGPELKDVEDPSERRELLRESLILSTDCDISGKNVLLVDDLYRSGATLSVATERLLGEARAKAVYVLTMTKTRSRR